MENWTNAKLCDVANLILGAVLFVSPWVFSFAALAIAALAAFAVWEEWRTSLSVCGHWFRPGSWASREQRR